jgi:hypothetical protein
VPLYNLEKKTMMVNLALKASKLSTEGDAFRTGIEKVNK